MKEIVELYNLNSNEYEIIPFGDGLINSTYKVVSKENGENFILQKININVFKDPEIINKNTFKASQFLESKDPSYLFISPIKTKDGNGFAVKNNEYWRLTPFIKDSISINKAINPSEAEKTGQAFGHFARLLTGLNVDELKATIPNFHNLNLRFNQFKEALKKGNKERIKIAEKEIEILKEFEWVNQKYLDLINNSDIPQRLLHHDAKINNVLFHEETNEALCLCDLDTLMPGIIFSDFGDLIRTTVCLESEESIKFEDIIVDLELFKSLSNGFVKETKSILAESEKSNLLFSGYFLIYMQSLRFLTDFLLDDIYYQIKYKNHNLNRARNQIALLKDYHLKKNKLQTILDNVLE